MVAAAVALPLLLTDDASERSESLTIPEGRRSGQVYKAVDEALGKPEGTTAKAAEKADLALPEAAEGNPEGYLYPATYPIDDKSTPASVLSFMVNTAKEKFGSVHVAQGAERNDISVYQTVVVASIVQAEADSPEDMGKVARVVFNRLDKGMALQMDSTLNYALDRSTLDTTHEDTRAKSPYNTYAQMGLPPTPIGNPGEDAMRAAISPTSGDWLYFVTVKPGDTRFTPSYQKQQENVAEFNRNRKSAASESG